MCYLNPEIIAA